MSRRTKTRRTNKNQARRAAPSLGKRSRLTIPLLIAVALLACILGSVLLIPTPGGGQRSRRVKNHYPEERYCHLGAARYYAVGPAFFGIASRFITRDMRGRFDHTLIIMMGCSGLRTRVTAQAFPEKGARAVVGWDEDVSASHTDTATQRLLEQLFVEGLPVSRAIAQTMAEVGPDPAYGAELQILFAAE